MSAGSSYRHLFTPLRLGPVTVANRIVFAAHLTNYAEGGMPTAQHTAYYAARAAGGAGLIITEEHSTHPADRLPARRRTPLHQADEIRLAYRLRRIKAEPVERLRRPVPDAAVTFELAPDVVVTPTRRRRQVRGEPSGCAPRDLVRRLHTTNVETPAKPRKSTPT